MPKPIDMERVCDICRWFRPIMQVNETKDTIGTSALKVTYLNNPKKSTHLGTCCNVESDECGRVLVALCPACDSFEYDPVNEPVDIQFKVPSEIFHTLKKKAQDMKLSPSELMTQIIKVWRDRLEGKGEEDLDEESLKYL